jgi:6-phosphofructokinase 1
VVFFLLQAKFWHMATPRRIGILTAGGDCPGLNAVIRGVVKSAGTHGYEVIGFLRGYEGLVDPVTYIPLTHKNTTGILSQGGTILGSTNKGRFVATVGINDRKELDPELVAGVKATVEQLGLEGLICVGGDGSLAVAQQFHEHGIPVVGVPKTIDNDLSSTAFSFGFFSAVFCATDALDRLHTTAASHERVMVLEVMGRHAGWIALFAGIAGGGDVILIPEIPWTFENVCQAIIRREQRGKRFTLVVVAEGATLPSGQLVAQACRADQGQVRLGGIGNIVGQEIECRLGKETRTVVLGHLQRGGNPTTFDRVLATQLGAHAVRLIVERKFGRMVTYQPPEIEDVPILDAIRLSTVSPDCSAVQAARALGISFGDDYHQPPFQPACGDASHGRQAIAPGEVASPGAPVRPARQLAEPEPPRATAASSRPVNPRK